MSQSFDLHLLKLIQLSVTPYFDTTHPLSLTIVWEQNFDAVFDDPLINGTYLVFIDFFGYNHILSEKNHILEEIIDKDLHEFNQLFYLQIMRRFDWHDNTWAFYFILKLQLEQFIFKKRKVLLDGIFRFSDEIYGISKFLKIFQAFFIFILTIEFDSILAVSVSKVKLSNFFNKYKYFALRSTVPSRMFFYSRRQIA